MWEINVGDQIVTFMLSLALGAVMCFCYDIIRAARKSGFNSFLAVFLTDIIYCLVFSIVTFIFLIARTNGEIRVYVLFAMLVGFVLFRVIISKLIIKIFTFLFKLLSALKKLLGDFLYGGYRKIEQIFCAFGCFTAKKFKTVLKRVKKLLKNTLGLLYTKANNVKSEDMLDETKAQA